MCGITVYITKNSYNDQVLSKVSHRGPDLTNKLSFKYKDYNIIFVFNRLAIIDLKHGVQPFVIDNKFETTYVVCNGEIYNYIDIIEKYNFSTKSDCHVIIDLYSRFGIENTVNELDGEFSFVLVNINKINNEIKLYACRDRFGIRPLFYYKDETGLYFSSELKGLPFNGKGKQIIPRQIYSFDNNFSYSKITYYTIGFNKIEINHDIKTQIRNYLFKSVNDRLQSERPVGALLSGGLDSSLICGIASEILKLNGKQLHTFSIGIEIDSPDIIYARKVATHIDSIHHEIIIPVEEWINNLENVIKQIETYDITTIRASTGQYLLAKWISENTDIKVVLNGDGSDELTSGYLYFFNAPDDDISHAENIRLLSDIYKYDVLRVDRGISAFGLEARVPFLSHFFVDMYLSIDSEYRNPITNIRCEKFLLRKSFENTNIIPNDVLFRQKEAFSDAISNKRKSWFEYIHEYVDTLVPDSEFENNNKFKTKESYWYYKTYKKYYPESNENVLYWMPKWTTEHNGDPSARKLTSLVD